VPLHILRRRRLLELVYSLHIYAARLHDPPLSPSYSDERGEIVKSSTFRGQARHIRHKSGSIDSDLEMSLHELENARDSLTGIFEVYDCLPQNMCLGPLRVVLLNAGAYLPPL
jgi:hypothetical protein